MINEIKSIVEKVLHESAYLHLKGIEPGSGTFLLAYKIAEHIVANYNLKKKNAWYGVDLDAKINDLKQDLAIACAYKKKFGSHTPNKPIDKQFKLF
jgi:hypothetical protein